MYKSTCLVIGFSDSTHLPPHQSQRFEIERIFNKKYFSVQFSVGEACEHRIGDLVVHGRVMRDKNIFTLQGRISHVPDMEQNTEKSVSVSPQIIINWSLHPGAIVQTSTVMWSTGLSGQNQQIFDIIQMHSHFYCPAELTEEYDSQQSKQALDA